MCHTYILSTDTRSQKGHSEVIGQFPANIRLPSELKDLSFFPGEVLMAFHFIPSNPKQRKEAQVRKLTSTPQYFTFMNVICIVENHFSRENF